MGVHVGAMSELAVKFMTMVEQSREIEPMKEFFQERAADFESLEVEGGKVVGEHQLVWTEHHKAYMSLVEEKLGVSEFCKENACDEQALMCSMRVLVEENSDVLMFFDSLISTTNYDGFLELAYNVKNDQHCFKPHLNNKCSSGAAGHGHGGHGHGHSHGH